MLGPTQEPGSSLSLPSITKFLPDFDSSLLLLRDGTSDNFSPLLLGTAAK